MRHVNLYGCVSFYVFNSFCKKCFPQLERGYFFLQGLYHSGSCSADYVDDHCACTSRPLALASTGTNPPRRLQLLLLFCLSNEVYLQLFTPLFATALKTETQNRSHGRGYQASSRFSVCRARRAFMHTKVVAYVL